ncbi:hypothetical protein AMAG_03564 [Allomyces macrogynus ATCC 38327]|uniref:Piwi domain-containing protein n=1 Tax=Allomyces macrogynus (strain ATCC 38327) TaxID=578462 RepID=A0A0L0S9H4_ALLM3|nr:hypothetical protein AMAG_03564 [Allomyces macrogynus ATCC 38327]|eukprot:KNE59253.1 hypothetical protein AMAG_03564 [Allomyces macrogynus ATCC 38327]
MEGPLIPRPGFGTVGRPVRVKTNHWRMLGWPEGRVVQYHVEFSRGTVTKTLARKIWAQWERQRGPRNARERVAYDGMAIAYWFGRGDLPQEDLERERAADVDLGRIRPFVNGEIRISHEVMIALSALEVVLRHAPAQLFKPRGRGAFYDFGTDDIPMHGDPLGRTGLELRRGLYMGLTACHGRLTINYDLSHGVFVGPGSLVEEIPRLLDKHLCGRQVQMTHRHGQRLKKKIFKFTEQRVADVTFTLDGAGEITVPAYFLRTYNARVEFPSLPAIIFRGRLGDCYVPVEFTALLSKPFLGLPPPEAVSEIVKKATVRPEQRFREIERQMRDIARVNDAGVLGVDDHSLFRVDPRFMVIPGRVLPAPRLTYGNCYAEPAELAPNGWNLCGKQLLSGAMATVALLNLAGPADAGRPVSEADFLSFYQQMQAHAAEHERPGLILVVLADGNKSRYNQVKAAGDLVLGIATQCYLANVLTKVNVKITATNQYVPVNWSLSGRVPFLSVPAMIVSIDVSHAAPDSALLSIAAMVASMNPSGTVFCAQLSAQAARQEHTIDQLRVMAKTLLTKFIRANRSWPRRILVLRDGVSEGMLAHVTAVELKALRAAYAELAAAVLTETAAIARGDLVAATCGEVANGTRLDPDLLVIAPPPPPPHPQAQPKYVYVIVIKRTKTRFAPSRDDHTPTDMSGNVVAGLAVDKEITHPTHFELFLQSQAGLQGTSVPAKYTVTVDEIGHTPDELQTMLFSLCFTFQRATRSISVPAPVRYAHLAATRGMAYLSALRDPEMANQQQQHGQIQPRSNVAGGMFFM